MMSRTPSIGLVMEGRKRGDGALALVLRIEVNFCFGLWIKENGELPAQESNCNASVLRWYKRDPRSLSDLGNRERKSG